MAELLPQERLQPSLLDRLIDTTSSNSKTPSSSEKEVEGAHRFVEKPSEGFFLSARRLKEIVRRDLEILLNTSCLADIADLQDFPLVAGSVLNYGVPHLAGGAVDNIQVNNLERQLKHNILTFETRIIPESLQITMTKSDEMSRNAVRFEIECDIWGQPAPEYLFMRSELDLETGTVRIVDNIVS